MRPPAQVGERQGPVLLDAPQEREAGLGDRDPRRRHPLGLDPAAALEAKEHLERPADGVEVGAGAPPTDSGCLRPGHVRHPRLLFASSKGLQWEPGAPVRRIEYAGSVHDDEEIAAVVAVLEGGGTALRIGRNVRAFEQRVADLFGKRRGIMCNSGSSALYLAVELLDLPPGAEVATSVLTFSTDVAPLVRAGLVPVFVDVEPDTFNLDVESLERVLS